MLIRGVVEKEFIKKFDNGKVLREVDVWETFSDGTHEKVRLSVWGENGIDTKKGAKVDCEVKLQIDRFTGKDGQARTKAKLVAIV